MPLCGTTSPPHSVGTPFICCRTRRPHGHCADGSVRRAATNERDMPLCGCCVKPCRPLPLCGTTSPPHSVGTPVICCRTRRPHGHCADGSLRRAATNEKGHAAMRNHLLIHPHTTNLKMIQCRYAEPPPPDLKTCRHAEPPPHSPSHKMIGHQMKRTCRYAEPPPPSPIHMVLPLMRNHLPTTSTPRLSKHIEFRPSMSVGSLQNPASMSVSSFKA